MSKSKTAKAAKQASKNQSNDNKKGGGIKGVVSKVVGVAKKVVQSRPSYVIASKALNSKPGQAVVKKAKSVAKNLGERGAYTTVNGKAVHGQAAQTVNQLRRAGLDVGKKKKSVKEIIERGAYSTRNGKVVRGENARALNKAYDQRNESGKPYGIGETVINGKSGYYSYDPANTNVVPRLMQETGSARKEFQTNADKLTDWQGKVEVMNQNNAARAGTTPTTSTGGAPTTPVSGGQPTPAGTPAPVPGAGGTTTTTGAPGAPTDAGAGVGGYVPGQGTTTTETTTTTGGEGAPVSSAFDLDSRINEIRAESEQRVRQAQDLLNQQREMLDSSTNALIDSINNKFEARIGDMRESNSRFYATAEKQGFRSGRSRYAPLVQAGILTGEEEAGIQRIAGLQSEQLSLIQQAQTARDSQSLAALTSYMGQIDNIHKEKMGAINDMYNLAVRYENLALDRQRENRLAAEAQFDQSLKVAESIAPSFIDDISKFSSPQDKMAYITEVAAGYNIDPLILLGSIEEATADDRKSQLELQKLEASIRSENALTASRYAGMDGEDGADGASGRRDEGAKYELKTIGSGRSKRAAKYGIGETDIQGYGQYLAEGGTPEEFRKGQVEAGVLASGSKGYKFVKRIARRIKNS